MRSGHPTATCESLTLRGCNPDRGSAFVGLPLELRREVYRHLLQRSLPFVVNYIHYQRCLEAARWDGKRLLLLASAVD